MITRIDDDPTKDSPEPTGLDPLDTVDRRIVRNPPPSIEAQMLAALEEVEFIVDGMEDIDGNGNPNTAMKIMAAIEPILRKVRA